MVFDEDTLSRVVWTGRRHVISDESRAGFAIKVMSLGSKQFYYRFRQDGKRREVALGRDFLPALTMYEVLKASTLPQPPDPVVTITDCLFEKGNTLESLAEAFLKKHVQPNLSGLSHKQYSAFLESLMGYCQSKAKHLLHGQCTSTQARKAIKTYLLSVADSAPISAARQMSCYSSMFKWGVGQDLVSDNPVHDIPMSRSKPRNIYLKQDELNLFLSVLSDGQYAEPTKDALRLILLTCLRPGEVISITPDMLDIRAQRLILPKTKNGRPHLVPLTAKAMEILERNIDPSKGSSRRLFKTTTWGLRQVANRACQRAGITIVCPHDLRRTSATMAASLGVPQHVIAALLNHTSHSVTSMHYVIYDLEKERRFALETLEGLYRELGMDLKTLT